MELVIKTNSLTAGKVETKIADFYAENSGKLPVKIVLAKNSSAVLSAWLEEKTDENFVGIVMKLVDGKPTRLGAKELDGMGFLFDDNGDVTNSFEAAVSGVFHSGYYPCEINVLDAFVETKKVEIESGFGKYEDDAKLQLANGYPEEEILRVLTVLKDNRVAVEVADAVMKFRSERKYSPESPLLKSWYIPSASSETHLQDGAIAILMGEAQIFEGIQSTGKTLLARTLAFVFNLPVYKEEASDSKLYSDLLCPRTTDNSAANMITSMGAEARILAESGDTRHMKQAAEYEAAKALAASMRIIIEETPLMKAIRNGGIYIYDEMNLGDANANTSVFNPLLDRAGSFVVPGLGTINIHPDFRFIGTQNPGFSGTNDENQAVRDRCEVNEIQPSTDENAIRAQLYQALKELLSEEEIKKVSDAKLRKVASFHKELVKSVTGKVLPSSCLSIRGLTNALANNTKYPAQSLRTGLIRNIANKIKNENQKTIVIDKIESIFSE